ncbi:hypothetical protein [Microvirga sp. 2TAF3]
MRTEPRRKPGRLYKRVLWFCLIYAASLGAFAAIVYALRGLIRH